MELHLVSTLLLLCFGYPGISNLVLSGLAIESPHYTVVHTESDLEIRLYRESLWVSAPLRGSSFENSTKAGFHRLYQYLHGSNLNSARFAMTAPVLTSVTPTTNTSIYYVRIYMSDKSAPQPNPELNLQIDKWRSHCIAVRNFTGFAKDDNINQEVEALVNSLNKHFTGDTTIPKDKKSYTIAQYNASRHLTGRLNEVWMNFSGFTAEGCPNCQGDHY